MAVLTKEFIIKKRNRGNSLNNENANNIISQINCLFWLRQLFDLSMMSLWKFRRQLKVD